MSINRRWNPCDIGQYKTVTKIQEQLQKENAEYICAHPETRAIVRTILHEAINRNDTIKPSELAATVFDLNKNILLKTKIDKERTFVLAQLKKGCYDAYDFERFNPMEGSTHSLLSSTSVSKEIDSILSFCFIMPKSF